MLYIAEVINSLLSSTLRIHLPVFEPCVLRFRNLVYKVRHGQRVLNPVTCERCRCNDGDLVDCIATTDRNRSNVCDIIPPGSRVCRVRGVVIPHGEKRRVRMTCKP